MLLAGDSANVSTPGVRAWPMYLACAISTLLLFGLSLLIDDTVNKDGIDYLYAAHEWLSGNNKSALEFRTEWLFYGQIALLTKYTGLSLLTSAFLLSLSCQTALACGYMAVVRALGGDARVQWIGLIVFVSLIALNEMRPHILRGFGFWAAQLWALWAVIQLTRTGLWRYAFAWLGCSAVALVFRVEGVVYLAGTAVLAPLVVHGRGRWQLICISFMLGVLAVASVGWLELRPPDPAGADRLSPIARLHRELGFADQVAAGLEVQKERIRDAMPNIWARDTASHMLIGGLLFHVLVILLTATHGLLLIIALAAARHKGTTDPVGDRLIAAWFAIGILVALYTVASRFFVTDRYLFMPALLLCVPLPFMLNEILSRYRNREERSQANWRTHLLVGMICIIPVLSIAKPIVKNSNDKMYIREAAGWVKKTLPASSTIYYNDSQVAFYAGDYNNHSFLHSFQSLDQIREQAYEYAVLLNKKGTGLSEAQLSVNGQHLEAIFKTVNRRGHVVAVYRLAEAAEKTKNESP